MISEKLKTFLTDVVGMDVEQLTAAISSDKEEEVTYTGELYTEDQLNTAKENVKNDPETKKLHKNTGVEMAVKAARTKHGLEFEGKSVENLTEALIAKTLADANIEPAKQLTEAKTSLTTLQGRYDTDIGTKDSEILRLQSEVNNFNTNSKLSTYLPDKLQNISQKQIITLMKSEGYEFGDNEDGIFVGKLNGKTLNDKTEKPLPPDQICLDYATANKWIEGTPGREGDHQTGGNTGKFKSMNEKMKYMDENKINPMSPEGQKIVEAELEE